MTNNTYNKNKIKNIILKFTFDKWEEKIDKRNYMYGKKKNSNSTQGHSNLLGRVWGCFFGYGNGANTVQNIDEHMHNWFGEDTGHGPARKAGFYRPFRLVGPYRYMESPSMPKSRKKPG